MKSVAVIAGVGVAVLGVGGLGFFGWWNAETNDAKLLEVSCAKANTFFPVSSTCKLITHQKSPNGWFDVVIRMEYERTPMAWYDGLTKLPSSGKGTMLVPLKVPFNAGELGSLTRPTIGDPQAVEDGVLSGGEALWQKLNSDPANVAYDALVRRRYTKYGGTVVYVSALRRLKMWHAAVEVLSVPEMEEYNWELNPEWEIRYAKELDMVDQAPLEPADRKAYDQFLADLPNHGGWKRILASFKFTQATRAAGRSTAGASASRSDSTKGKS
jgi:hypothetical protein